MHEAAHPYPRKRRLRRVAGWLAAALVGTVVAVPVAAAPAFAACNGSSGLFMSTGGGATITTGTPIWLSGVVKPATRATFTFHVVRPNGNVRDFIVYTNLAGENTNCIIPHEAETFPAALLGKGDVTVHGSFVRREDNQPGTFDTSFHIVAGTYPPGPLPAFFSCGDTSHPFLTPSGSNTAFSGIVYPGTQVYFSMDMRLGGALALTVINPTVTAGGNCVVPHELDVLPTNLLLLANSGAVTDVYASYFRWENGAYVQNQFVTTLHH